jgi:hypothetical protein
MLRFVLLSACFVVACGGDATTDAQGGSGAQSAGGAGGQGGSAGNTGSGGSCEGCMSTFLCCHGACVNPNNDILNCGDCDLPCPDVGGAPRYCDGGTCGTPPCAPNVDCGPGSTCCDQTCCDAGELCCTIPGPIGDTIQCVDPAANGGTCPTGCTDCKCAAPTTMVATPQGNRPIAELAIGDLVYSVDHDATVVVPIVFAWRKPVTAGHEVVVVDLANGAHLEMSPGHPTADGRTFAALRAGDRLDGFAVQSVRRGPYPYDATYDIQPMSSSGVYFADGVAVGSTLVGQ